MLALRAILSSLDIPELEPVPRDHVLTKTFYLLKEFPGRFNSGQLWVEALPAANDEEPASRPARAGDGVSSIIITSNDFAGAWAMRPDGQAMLPLVSAEPRQREFAFRAGVNIVMYTLTGNYKADQVHVPACSSGWASRRPHCAPALRRSHAATPLRVARQKLNDEFRHLILAAGPDYVVWAAVAIACAIAALIVCAQPRRWCAHRRSRCSCWRSPIPRSPARIAIR